MHLSKQVRDAARQQHSTLYGYCLACFNALLYRSSRASVISVGCGAANRKSKESEPIVGMFVNNLVQQLATNETMTARDFVTATSSWLNEAQDYSDIPFNDVVQALAEKRDFANNPLFQIMFNTHEAAVSSIDQLDLGVAVEEVRENGSSKFDMNIILIPESKELAELGSGRDEQGIRIMWEYSSDLFDRDTIEELAETYSAFLAATIEHPNQSVLELPILDPDTAEPLSNPWLSSSDDSHSERPLTVTQDELTNSTIGKNLDDTSQKAGSQSFTPTEQIIADMLSELLNQSCNDPLADLFDLGCHSLTLMQLVIRIKNKWKVNLSVIELFDKTTIREVAAHIDELSKQ